jgi:hypothetical protein
MGWLDILTAQLLDPFRIALLIALVYTMERNRAATGTLVPLLAGMLFVAVIIPTTLSPPAGEVPMWRVVAVGLVANAAILAVVLAIWTAVQRARR